MTTEDSEYLTPAQVAVMFSVDPKTVSRWANAGKLPPSFRTMGGHRRWVRAEVERMREQTTATR